MKSRPYRIPRLRKVGILCETIACKNIFFRQIKSAKIISTSLHFQKFRTRPSWRNLEMVSKLPRLNQSNPDSIPNKYLEKAEANTKYKGLRRTTRIRKPIKIFDARVNMDIENEAKKIHKWPTTFILRNLPISLRARYRVTMNCKLPNVKGAKSCSRWSKTYHYKGFLGKIIKYRAKWIKLSFFFKCHNYE